MNIHLKKEGWKCKTGPGRGQAVSGEGRVKGEGEGG
jgi:hypothetical protein